MDSMISGEGFGLLGEHLSHSFSPEIHRELGGYAYDLLPMPPEAVADFLRRRAFRGINVTIPYKRTVIPYLDRLSPRAKALGAVNTIVKDAEGLLTGYNTDYAGFQTMLERLHPDIRGRKCLVLGSGGASHPVAACLRDLGAGDVRIISRRGEDNYTNLDRHRDACLLVNATPVGMYPHNGERLVNLDDFPALCAVMDLIYHPARTALLLDAERRGIPHINGLLMLVAQAREASQLFTGRAVPLSEVDRVTFRLEARSRNLILIGMPGSGKSTVGRILANRLGREWLDTDSMIESAAGRTCGDLIRQEGEDAFREKETAALREAGKQSGKVISVGGGAVTRPENRDLLRQNGWLIHLDRPPEVLSTAGDRPLSADRQALLQRYAERNPLYEAWRDLAVSADTPEKAADQILTWLGDKSTLPG